MIDNLEEKLDGIISVTREELMILVSSWGRKSIFFTHDNMMIDECEPKECYPLEKLDISKITDLGEIFNYSFYNGDLSKWNTSSCIVMYSMFSLSDFNNDSLNNWNLSNVTNMEFMFYQSLFNGDISNWNISNVNSMKSSFDNCPFDGDISKWKFNENVDCEEIFCDNQNFLNKYNFLPYIPDNTRKFLKWFEENRTNISNFNVTKEEILDIDDYLYNFEKKELTNGN